MDQLQEFIEELGFFRTVLLAGIGFVVCLVVTALMQRYQSNSVINKDNHLPTLRVRGKVLEKMIETHRQSGVLETQYTVEWIIIGDEHGNRRKVRNTRTREILITTGDEGVFLIRGETIASFQREVRIETSDVVVAAEGPTNMESDSSEELKRILVFAEKYSTEEGMRGYLVTQKNHATDDKTVRALKSVLAVSDGQLRLAVQQMQKELPDEPNR